MVDRKSLLCRFDIKGSFPEPFEYQEKKRIEYIDINGNPGSGNAIIAVFKAVITMVALEMSQAGESVRFTDLHKDVAIGSRSNSDGFETIYVERKSKSKENLVEIVKYNPSTGALSGCFYNTLTNRTSEYSLKRGEADGTAIFLALFSEFREKNPTFPIVYQEVKELLEEGKRSEPLSRIMYLSDIVYDTLTKTDKIALNYTSEEILPQIPATNISKGFDGPSKGKVEYGDFKILKVGDKVSPATEKKETDLKLTQIKELPFVRTKKDFSPLEVAMIPKISNIHVVSEEERFIVSEIVDTFNDPINCIKTIMLLGQSSSGKSHLAETLAARMQRPYSAPLTCTPNMDETTLLGTTLPVIEGGAARDKLSKRDNALLEKMYSAGSEEESLNIIAEHLHIPDTEVILYDPKGAYEEITGKSKPEITSSEVIRLAQNQIGSKVAELVKKLPKGDGVQYMYYKSPLVKSIENGWMIEIQEFNVCKEAAIFTSLNNVFDKEANGILETPYGQVVRHPDFRAVYTANPNYAGCRDPHQSVIARSDMIVTMNNPAESVMKERVKSRMEFEDNELLDMVVEAFVKVTNKAIDLSCEGEATMRELYRFANAIGRNIDPEMAIENYVINAITRDEEDKAELFEAACSTALLVNYPRINP